MEFGLPDGPARGLLVITMVTLALSALLGGVLNQQKIGRSLGRLARRLARKPEPATRLPIERIARNARRLRAELATLPSGTPMARRRGLSYAYDDLLADACRALDVPDTISGMAPGLERDHERLNLEHRLEEVGLRLSA